MEHCPLTGHKNHTIKTLRMIFGLEYQFLTNQMNHTIFGDSSLLGTPSIKLRNQVLKDCKVLQNNIINVSKFMDSKVNVDLMEACAQELSQWFIDTKPTKIMMVATTSLVIAL